MTVSAEYDRRIGQFFAGIKGDLGREIVIGVLGTKAAAAHGKGEGDKPTTVDVATWMEFGVPGRIPARSFLRDTLAKKRTEILKVAATELRAYMIGKRPAADAWERIGLVVVGLVQKRIADGIPPGLSQVTIDRKGSSKPLIDTGQLRSSITFEVRG